MSKLKIIAKVPVLGLEILSDQRWINNSRDYIINMEDDHLRNAVMWAYRRWQDEQGARLAPQEIYGYTYRQWYQILKACYDQRIENQQKQLEKPIQRLHQVVESRSFQEVKITSSHSRYSHNYDYSNEKDRDFDTGIDAWMY